MGLDHGTDPDTDTDIGTPRSPSTAGWRSGQLLSAAVNAALLYVVHRLPDWDVLPFLTDDYDRVLPALRLALGAAVAVALIRALWRHRLLVVATDAVTIALNLAATVRLFQVFPFDFSGYDVRWDLVARGVLLIAMTGLGIALLVVPVRLLSYAVGDRDR